MNLDGLLVDLIAHAVLLVHQEISHILALVTLELNDITSQLLLRLVFDHRAIAGKLFLNDLKNLPLVVFGVQALDGGQ